MFDFELDTSQLCCGVVHYIYRMKSDKVFLRGAPLGRIWDARGFGSLLFTIFSFMCGRFVRKTDLREAAKFFSASLIETDLGESYNIAPKQPVVVVMEDGKRKLVSMRWGLIPPWSNDPNIGYKMINARAETILGKASFKNAFKHRRCLIVADGFYEWREENARKVPVYIFLKDKGPFGMAGIYETWKPATGEAIKTCSIITTEANEFMKPIHHRMPVIVRREDEDAWLNPQTDEKSLLQILKPLDASLMDCHDVSPAVNSPTHDAKDLINPV
jgi:putative SOS response-associated peptidase YedK